MKIQFFPTRNITFKTTLTEAQVFERLEALITTRETDKTYVYSGNNGEDIFFGEITPPTFKVIEIVAPRSNSFVPFLYGRVEQENGQTLITVKMRLPGCIIAFVSVWCYQLFLFLYLNMSSWIRGNGFEMNMFLISIGGLSFMLAMMHVAFSSGAKSAKDFLTKTFEGEFI